MATTRKQFSRVFEFEEQNPTLLSVGDFPEHHPLPGSTIQVFIYYYRGERTEIRNVFPHKLEAANKIKEEHVNQDYMEFSEDFRALADEHRKALQEQQASTA
jgi:hypothetical protein